MTGRLARVVQTNVLVFWSYTQTFAQRRCAACELGLRSGPSRRASCLHVGLADGACSSAPTPPLPCCPEWCGGQEHNNGRQHPKFTFARTDTLTASVGLHHPHRLPRFSVGGRRRGRSHGLSWGRRSLPGGTIRRQATARRLRVVPSRPENCAGRATARHLLHLLHCLLSSSGPDMATG